MDLFPPTFILRHRKENKKKCSLRGLEQREDLLFFEYPTKKLPDVSHCILLTFDAPALTREDNQSSLFIIDGTWRHAEIMSRQVPPFPIKRSLPAHFQTAYPRRHGEFCSEPERGLATVEALYIAYWILGRDTTGLLDQYHWREAFLQNFKCAVERSLAPGAFPEKEPE